MKPLITDGTVYTKQYVEGLKQPLQAVRNCLIDADKLSFAYSLSEIHAILDYYCKQVDETQSSTT